MYHYTYLLLHKTTAMRYIGVRTSEVPPLQDIHYWGSSKYIPSDVKQTHLKIILKEFPTREEAVNHEILLHDLNNVAASPNFYNKSKQTSTTFDTSGITLSEEHKEKCRIASTGKTHTQETKDKLSKLLKGRVFSPESRQKMSDSQKALAKQPHYRNGREGLIVTQETREKISKAVKEKQCNNGINNNTFKPWFIIKDGVKTIYDSTTKREKSLSDGYSKGYYNDLSNKSKGIYPIKRGPLKGIIIGNVIKE